MSEVALDPLASLPADVSPDIARSHTAALVLGGGVTVEAANAALAARGAAGLTANSKEMAEAARTALLNDSAFVAKYAQGDPEAIAKLFQADLRVQQTSGKLLDRAPAPADYTLKVAPHLPPDASPERVQTYSDDLAKLASAIQLPKESAAALVDDHFAAIRETAAMGKDEQSLWGQQQAAMLHNALGANAEEQIKAASDLLSRAGGRTLDIAKIVQSNGASLALTLVHQAQVLARQRE